MGTKASSKSKFGAVPELIWSVAVVCEGTGVPVSASLSSTAHSGTGTAMPSVSVCACGLNTSNSASPPPVPSPIRMSPKVCRSAVYCGAVPEAAAAP